MEKLAYVKEGTRSAAWVETTDERLQGDG